jgi:hypothetical protein
MPHYWVIAPFSNKRSEFGKVWAFDLANGIISIGFTELPDVSQLSKKELRQSIRRDLKGRSTRTKNYYFQSLWDFYHSIKPGHIIVARRGVKRILAIGAVIRAAYYEPNKNPHAEGKAGPYSNHLHVRWEPIEKSFDDLEFRQDAIYRISEDRFRKLTQGIPKKANSLNSRFIEAQIVDSPRHHQLDYIFRSKTQIIQATKDEEPLVRDYRHWLERQERECRAARYGKLQCDVFEERRRNLIEAKSSVRREYIRMAVGQLLDYAFHIGKKFPNPNMAVLLPRKPDPSSIDWLPQLNISVIWRQKGTFFDNANGKFSGR